MTAAKLKATDHLEPSYEQLIQLLEVVRIMGVEKDLDRLLSHVADHCIRAIEGDRCSIFLVDQKRGEVWSRLMQGEQKEIRFPLNVGIAGECISSGRPLNIEDAYNHPKFNREIDQYTGYQTRNLLCIPMTNHAEEVIGCFEVINKRHGVFTAADQALLTAFGAQVGVAIESALLYRDREAMIQSLVEAKESLDTVGKQRDAVYAIEKFASHPSLDISVLAEASLTKTLEVVDAECAVLLLQHLEDGAAHYYGLARGSSLRHESVVEVPADPFAGLVNFAHHSFNRSLEGSIRKAMIVDGPEKEEMLGMIGIAGSNKGAFTDGDRNFLDMIASQIASVCEKQRLFRQKSDSERLAMVGKLVSTVVHDIRNPMSTIRGLSELIARSPEMDHAEIVDFFRIIDNEVLRCNTLLDELLDFAGGKKKLRPKQVNIEDFLETISLSLKAQAERKGISFEVVNKTSGSFCFDPDRLMRVIFNIANNSYEVLSVGGVFRLELEERNQELHLTMRDDGPGVPEAIQSKIFKAFVTYGKSSGTGLGMHIAREIVEAHGGKIWLDPMVKKGACFRVVIPPQKSDS